MFFRSLISLLLILSLSMVTTGRSAAKQEGQQEQPKKVVLTPDEEREAHALAEEFIERIEKSDDVTPLVTDLFVSDFTERLRSNMDTNFPLAATPDVAAQMSSDEILRAYTASINCMYLAFRLAIEFERKHHQERVRRGETTSQEVEPELIISEIIPSNIVELIQSDPLLAALLEQVLRAEKKEREVKQSEAGAQVSSTSDTVGDMSSGDDKLLDEIWPFKNVEQMRHYTSLAEQAVKLLHEHFNSLPSELKPPVNEFMTSLKKKKSADEDSDDADDGIDIYPYVLTTESMGYSPGTIVICITASVFHIDTVRDANGRLKIVNAHVVLGD